MSEEKDVHPDILQAVDLLADVVAAVVRKKLMAVRNAALEDAARRAELMAEEMQGLGTAERKALMTMAVGIRNMKKATEG